MLKKIFFLIFFESFVVFLLMAVELFLWFCVDIILRIIASNHLSSIYFQLEQFSHIYGDSVNWLYVFYLSLTGIHVLIQIQKRISLSLSVYVDVNTLMKIQVLRSELWNSYLRFFSSYCWHS